MEKKDFNRPPKVRNFLCRMYGLDGDVMKTAFSLRVWTHSFSELLYPPPFADAFVYDISNWWEGRFFHEHFGDFFTSILVVFLFVVGANSIHLIPRWTRQEHFWNETSKKTRKDVVEATCWGHFGQIPLLKYVYLRNVWNLTNSNTPVVFLNRDLWGFWVIWSFKKGILWILRIEARNGGVVDPSIFSRVEIPMGQGFSPPPPRPQGVKTWWHNRGGAKGLRVGGLGGWGVGGLGGWGVGVGILWFETRFWWEKHFSHVFFREIPQFSTFFSEKRRTRM